jgi:hypothetical protein
MGSSFSRYFPSGSELLHLSRVFGLVSLFLIAIAFDIVLAAWMFRHDMNDFGKFYYTSRFFLDGENMYAPSPATLIPVSDIEWRQFTNMNPPHFHLLVLPLALLRPIPALVGWTALSLGGLALSVRIMVSNLGWPALSRRQLTLLIIYLLSWVGTGTVILTGQLSWVLLWPMAGAWSAARRDRWVRAGVLLGLVASVKPFVLLLVAYLAIRRKWVALFAAGATLVSLFVLGLAVFGPAAHAAWLTSLGGMNWAWAVMNGSLLGFLARVLEPGPQLGAVVFAPRLVQPLWVTISVGGVLLTLVAAARQSANVDRAFALLTAASLLFSPLGWVYYAWFLVPPMLGMVRGGFVKRHRVATVVVLVASLCPVSFAHIGQPSAWATLTIGSLYFWTLVVVWAVLLKDACDEPGESPARCMAPA